MQTLRVRVVALEEDGVIVQGSEAASNEEGFSSDNVWLEVSSPFLSFACPSRARRANADKLNGISIQPRLVFALLRLRLRLQTTPLESRSFPLTRSSSLDSTLDNDSTSDSKHHSALVLMIDSLELSQLSKLLLLRFNSL